MWNGAEYSGNHICSALCRQRGEREFSTEHGKQVELSGANLLCVCLCVCAVFLFETRESVRKTEPDRLTHGAKVSANISLLLWMTCWFGREVNNTNKYPKNIPSVHLCSNRNQLQLQLLEFYQVHTSVRLCRLDTEALSLTPWIEFSRISSLFLFTLDDFSSQLKACNTRCRFKWD